MSYHKYTPDEIRFLKRKVKGRSRAELTRLFNEKFSLSLTKGQVVSYLDANKIRSDYDSRFKPGNIPFNKGLKGFCPKGSEKTWFKLGQKPASYRPVGSERINCDGYTEVKFSDKRKPAKKNWMPKHVFIWETKNGKVPKGHVIIFADGNKQNIELYNLIMVSRAELAKMNQMGLIYADKDLTKIGKSIAKLRILIAKRKRCSMKSSRKKILIVIDNNGNKVFVSRDPLSKKWVSVRDKNNRLQKLWAKYLPPRTTFDLAQHDLKEYAIKRGWQLGG